tara:strand:- start:497 stop:748 length:252 start_codon:yes stop_codon:yes gene_type:complete
MRVIKTQQAMSNPAANPAYEVLFRNIYDIRQGFEFFLTAVQQYGASITQNPQDMGQQNGVMLNQIAELKNKLSAFESNIHSTT